MATITTIRDLLMFDGSAQPATVALTPNERRLIAAAPELLAALKRASDASDDGWLDDARAAIAKATGAT